MIACLLPARTYNGPGFEFSVDVGKLQWPNLPIPIDCEFLGIRSEQIGKGTVFGRVTKMWATPDGVMGNIEWLHEADAFRRTFRAIVPAVIARDGVAERIVAVSLSNNPTDGDWPSPAVE